jgi:hypothetical protein
LRRYARRRLNPYRGVEQVIESDSGRALSVDGRNWELQLLARRPAGWGSLNRQGALDYARYAVWSRTEGLARFPYFPATEFDPTAAAGLLIAAIAGHEADLPLALIDSYECWCCADARPMALLAAANALPEHRSVPRWRALPDDPQAAEVEERVRRASTGTHWFRRAADGSGEQLDAAALGQPPSLPAAAFAECLLAVDAFDLASDRSLISAYLERQAARLLMLPLSATTRAALEQAAIGDAPGVAHYCRLYPAQEDPGLITRLQVEARLRASA